ncbi:hypothetical protein MKEN_00099200 [Mycena kentingensis (nom. inval.)]|nr:hypothetical protein MKEN_00099200 [Mycena kentingensis (nom. inval.)]
MSYYPAAQSYAAPPVAYSGYPQEPAVVYATPTHTSHRSRRHRHHHHSEPMVVGAVLSSGHHHHSRHGRHHSYGVGYHGHLTFGERVRRFFGFGPRAYRHKSSDSSWGFLGRSRRRKYVDAHTGAEVDRKGRPVYRM